MHAQKEIKIYLNFEIFTFLETHGKVIDFELKGSKGPLKFISS